MAHLSLLLPLLLFLPSSSTVHAKSNSKQAKAHFELIKNKVESGDNSACGELGILYAEGRGVKQNFVQAARWTNYAAQDQRNVSAHLLLAKFYCEGKGVAQSYTRAAWWFEMADHWLKWAGGTPQQIADYQALTATLYPPMDALRKAGTRGEVDALLELGRYYYSISRIPYNTHGSEEFALQCLAAASVKGSHEATYLLAQYFLNSYITAANLTLKVTGDCNVELPETAQTPIAVIVHSAEKGNPEAQCLLGCLYYRGYGFPKSPSDAEKWYEKAAESNNIQAQVSLGQIALAAKDYSKAAHWLQKGSAPRFDQNSTYACYDLEEYVDGHPSAQFELGKLYEQGSGVAKDPHIAKMWYQRSSYQGNNQAKEALKQLELMKVSA